MKWFGKWFTTSTEEGHYTAGGLLEFGYMQYKIRFKLDKKNWEYIRAMLMAENPKVWSRMIDMTVDVWGSAGPDCCIQP